MKLSDISNISHKDEFGNIYDMTLVGTYDGKKFGLIDNYKIYIGNTTTKSGRIAHRLFLKNNDKISGISVDDKMVPSEIKQQYMNIRKKAN